MTTKAKQAEPEAPDPATNEPPAPTAAEVRVAELEAELAKLREAAAPKPAKDAPPTHVMYLADGSQVKTNAPVATHHSTEDGIVPVLMVQEIVASGEED